MAPKSAPKGTVEAGHEKGGEKGDPGLRIVRHFGVTWASLADFGDPLKSKGAPKTAQKIQYGDFLAPWGGQKVKKKGFGRRLEKA